MSKIIYNKLTKSQKSIIVSVDPGYNGCKICINGYFFCIPYNIHEIGGLKEWKEYDPLNASKEDDFIRLDIENSTYLLGSRARMYFLSDMRKDVDPEAIKTFYTLERFNSQLFEKSLKGMIGYALYKYEELSKDSEIPFLVSEIKNFDIYVGITLPHQFVDKYSASVIKFLSGIEHDFVMQIGNSGPIKFNFEIKELFILSQSLAALVDAVYDEFGYDKEGRSLKDIVPALVIDAGYKTLGNFKFERDQSITGSESNSDYAKYNVNKEVAEKARVLGAKVEEYNIEEKYELKEKIKYINSEGIRESFDVVSAVNNEIEVVVKNLIDYLMEKYNKLLDVKFILVAGGTGSLYFDYIKNYFEKIDTELAELTILAGGIINGEEYDSMYSIVIGLYKDMIGKIEALNEEEE